MLYTSMNAIGIDQSLSSTGLVVNGKLFSYSYTKNVYTKTGKLTKWFESCNHLVTIRGVDSVESTKNYQLEQINKLNNYDKITDDIVNDILENIDPSQETKVAMEGYSYESATGPLIDLVTFGTLLKKKINDLGFELIIVSPKSLKLESCKMCYEPIRKEVGVRKKKIVLEHRNNDGLAGGHFTKHDMYQAILDNEKWNDPWTSYLKAIKTDAMGNKKLPKPHEDLNDAYLLAKFSLLYQA